MPVQSRRRFCLLAAAAAAATASGCASLPTAPPAERVHGGRFAATTTLDGKSENTTGRFTLSIAGPRLTLDLATPLGTTLARVESGPEGARLQVPGNGDMREARGRNAEALSEELLGYALPVQGIGDWILGRPAPSRAARTREEDGRIVAIEQDGWSIEVADRLLDGAPRRLVFRRPARAGSGAVPPAPAITLRLVLDQ